MKQLRYKVITHSKQRYPTVGDYWKDKSLEDGYQVRVSNMNNDDYHFLVLIHELIELHLVNKRGIMIGDIDAFDKQFEKDREAGLHPIEAEPGDDPKAPYRKEHFFATSIERIIAHELGVDWEEYDNTVMNL